MKHYQYLILGGGLAGDAAVRGIRQLDPNGSIGMISMEPDPPYTRPYLSKGLWKGKPVEKVWRNTKVLGADIHLGVNVTQLDPRNKTLGDNHGNGFSYEKILLATGGSPLRLPFGGDAIIYYRNLRDYQRLRALTEIGERFLVIGGGFIGTEIAAALTMAGKKVTMIFPDQTIGAGIYPYDLSHFVTDYYRQKGVNVVTGDSVVSVERKGTRFAVRTKNGRSFEVDGVVAGIGIRPNVDLARQAGLVVDNGIVVDEHLRSSAVDIYAAGDVANFYHVLLGQRMRVEHEDNAVKMGELAGRNMAGAEETYTYAPMFYSDLFELGYEAVGVLSSELEMLTDWQDPLHKGIVYYMKDQRVRGVLLWNVWDKVPAARALLAEPAPFDMAALDNRL